MKINLEYLNGFFCNQQRNRYESYRKKRWTVRVVAEFTVKQRLFIKYITIHNEHTS